MPKARKRKTPPVIIDNSRYPTTDEVAKLFKIPPARLRWLKALAAESVKEIRAEKAARAAKKAAARKGK